MDAERPAATSAEAVQFTEYAFAVGKKMTTDPMGLDVWEIESLPLPESWVCTECPWTNQRDPDTGYRYAYGVPKKKKDALTGFAGPMNASPSFGIKRNGKFEGGLALGGISPPPWIPDGAFVFMVKQQPYAR